jgi:hypothetical protein
MSFADITLLPTACVFCIPLMAFPGSGNVSRLCPPPAVISSLPTACVLCLPLLALPGSAFFYSGTVHFRGPEISLLCPLPTESYLICSPGRPAERLLRRPFTLVYISPVMTVPSMKIQTGTGVTVSSFMYHSVSAHAPPEQASE